MDSPIFILSMERSGSTLLRYLLDAHQDVYSPDELHLGALCYQLALVMSADIRDAQELDPENFRVITIRDRDLRSLQLILSLTALRKIREVVEQLIAPLLESRDKRILCEKTPQNLGFADLLQAVFPDAKFVCLHRHCFDVCSSCLEAMRTGFGRGLAPYIKGSSGSVVEALAQAWIDKTYTLLSFEQRVGANCFRVRYEDLVGQPSVQLRSLFESLGLTYGDDIIERTFQMNHDQRPGRGDHKILRTTGIHVESVNRADRISTNALPGNIVEAANGLLRQLGYSAE